MVKKNRTRAQGSRGHFFLELGEQKRLKKVCRQSVCHRSSKALCLPKPGVLQSLGLNGRSRTVKVRPATRRMCPRGTWMSKASWFLRFRVGIPKRGRITWHVTWVVHLLVTNHEGACLSASLRKAPIGPHGRRAPKFRPVRSPIPLKGGDPGPAAFWRALFQLCRSSSTPAIRDRAPSTLPRSPRSASPRRVPAAPQPRFRGSPKTGLDEVFIRISDVSGHDLDNDSLHFRRSSLLRGLLRLELALHSPRRTRHPASPGCVLQSACKVQSRFAS